MVAAPLYSPGDTVYLRDSAALGFLEAYIVKTITYRADGQIQYYLATHLNPPTVSMTMGDRNTGRVLKQITFFEHDLIVFCDAIVLAITNTEKQLAALLAQYAVSCAGDEDGTEGTG